MTAKWRIKLLTNISNIIFFVSVFKMGFCDDERYKVFWAWTDRDLQSEISRTVKNLVTYINLAVFDNLKLIEDRDPEDTLILLRTTAASEDYRISVEQFLQQGESQENFYGFNLPNEVHFTLKCGHECDFLRLMELIKDTTGSAYKKREKVVDVPDDDDDVKNLFDISTALTRHSKYLANSKDLVLPDNMDIRLQPTQPPTANLTCPFHGCGQKIIIKKRLQTKWKWRIDCFTNHFKDHVVPRPPRAALAPRARRQQRAPVVPPPVL